MNIGNYNPVARYLGSTSVSALMLGAGSVWTNGPTIQLSASSIAENASVGDDVGTFSVVNPSGTYTFTLTDDAGGLFALNADGVTLEVAAALTAQNYSITVTASNGTDPDLTKIFTIRALADGVPEIVVAFYGQSNMGGFIAAHENPIPAPVAGTFRFDPVANVWRDSTYAWNQWGGGGNGILEFINALRAATGKTVGAVFCSYAARTLSALNNPTGEEWTEMSRLVTASGGHLDAVCWHQGEGDAVGPTPYANYLSGILTLRGMFANLCGKGGAPETLPFIVAGLASYTTGTAPASWDYQNQTLVGLDGAATNLFYSHSNYDATFDGAETLHWDGQSQGVAGKRYARAVAYALGYVGTKNLFAIDRDSCTIATATTTRVKVVHGGGTDFSTPSGATTGFTGFEVSGDGNVWIAATGARFDATTIELTHAALGTSIRYVRYQNGQAPDVSGEVVDNSTLAGQPLKLPLAPTGGNTTGVRGPITIQATKAPNFKFLGTTTGGTWDNTAKTGTTTITGTDPNIVPNRRIYFFGFGAPNGFPGKNFKLNGAPLRTVFAEGGSTTTTYGRTNLAIYTALNADADLTLSYDSALGGTGDYGAGGPLYVFAVDDTELDDVRPTDVKWALNLASGLDLSTQVGVNNLGAILALAWNDSTYNTYSTAGTPPAGFTAIYNQVRNPPNCWTHLDIALSQAANDALPVNFGWTGGTPSSAAKALVASFGGVGRKAKPNVTACIPDVRTAQSVSGVVCTTQKFWVVGDTDVERFLVAPIQGTNNNPPTGVVVKAAGFADIALTKIGEANTGTSTFSSLWSGTLPAGVTGFTLEISHASTSSSNENFCAPITVPLDEIASPNPVGGVQAASSSDAIGCSVTIPTRKNGFTILCCTSFNGGHIPVWTGIVPRSAGGFSPSDYIQDVTFYRSQLRHDLDTNAGVTVTTVPDLASPMALVAATWAPAWAPPA